MRQMHYLSMHALEDRVDQLALEDGDDDDDDDEYDAYSRAVMRRRRP